MAIAASLSQENATLWIIANQLFGEMARFSQTKTWYSRLLVTADALTCREVDREPRPCPRKGRQFLDRSGM
jgi:hypothetical protein